MVAGCHGGSSGNLQSDGPIADAPEPVAPDASTDAMLGTVSVTVYTWIGDGAIDPTAVAIFYDGAGNVLQDGTVDAQGVAYGDVPDGGSVTVLQAHTDPMDLTQRFDRFSTIRGLKTGDHLIIGVLSNPTFKSGATDTMTANYTALDPASGPSFLLACADADSTNAGAPYTFTFYATCETPTFDLLTLDSGNGMTEYEWQPGLTRTPNGSITVPNTWTPLSHTANALTNTAGNYALGVSLSHVVGGVPFLIDQAYLPAPTVGENDVSFRYAPVPTPMRFTALLNEGPAALERQVVVTTGSPATTTMDLAALPLPVPTHVTQTATGVTWMQVDQGTPDARFVTWSAMWSDANHVVHSAVWEILEPAVGTTSSLTSVPTMYANEDPTGAQLRGGSVFYVDYDNLAGYDAARPKGFSLEDVESSELDVDHVARSTAGGTYP